MRQGFLNTKNILLSQKKFGNGPELKLLDQNFLVLIENVLFRSRILFQKRIYSIFCGTKAPKQKLSILKERRFDIANIDTIALTDMSISSGITPLDKMSEIRVLCFNALRIARTLPKTLNK